MNETYFQKILEKHNIRMVDYNKTVDPFGDNVYYIHPHFMDWNNCTNICALFSDLTIDNRYRVGFYGERNAFIVKRR